MADFEQDPITEKIIGCCYAVHSSLGPGFNKKSNAKALQHQLAKGCMNFVAEKEFNVEFDGVLVDKFRCDLFVEG